MVEHKAHALEDLLNEFGVEAEVVNAEPGPAITMYELQLAPGVKVNQISNLANDIARALGSGTVRVVAPLAGKNTIGIEVPNSQREIVRIRDLILKGGGKISKMQIPLFLGKGSSGEALVSDLGLMPHLLIAGTTGSGKSVCINSIITSILMTRRPDEVKLILIDPKMVEMAAFESIPHLMCPTVTEMRRAEQILEWAMEKMDERYELLAEAKVRNVASYNKLTPEELIERFNPATQEEEAQIPKMLPHIVIVIDELADLMMTSAKEVEAFIVRIAQKSRAVGIHLVLATQRPQATVVTGLIKANMPARIAFRVAARMDSRIILDQNGAEALLGQGDMLFLIPGTSDLIRAQGAYLEDDELRNIVGFLKDIAQPQFHPELMQLNRVDVASSQSDEMFDEAVRIVLESQRGSVSLLQRRLSIGYARASRIIEMMAVAGILGEYKGSQAREVTMTLEDYEEMKRNQLPEEVAQYEDLSGRHQEDNSQTDTGHKQEEPEEEEEEEEEYLTQTEIIDDDNT
jgi:S-DNA-T family DNA segregation ATPase FtsK/SpoIIIE